MEKTRIGIVGLGRLGYGHAQNIAYRTPNAELSAVCSLSDLELERASLDFPTAKAYRAYDDMLQDHSLDAIFICSPSPLHVEQIEAAMSGGFHVFSEKPLGVTVAQCERAEKIVQAHSDRIFMLGFMRRYDQPYAYARQQIDSGLIGRPFLVRAYGLDPEASVAGAIRFAPTSGGIFLDMAVHEIDLANWILGGEPASVYAVGGSFVHPEFAAFGDCDNACALMQYQNGGIAMLYVGRTAAHGYHIETEIIGSKGALRISPIPQKNQVQIFNQQGVLQECMGGFLERFEGAYLNELHEFVDCIRSGRKPAIRVEDGTRATRIAFAATESYREKKVVFF